MSSATKQVVEDRDTAIRAVTEQLKRHKRGARIAAAKLKQLRAAEE